MSPDARTHALDLYTSLCQTTDLAILDAFAAQDSLTLQATTRLPWSVCLRLCQVARCRWWAAYWLQQRRGKALRREQQLLAAQARYFARLRRQQC